jgi:hypothetical protein
MVEAMREYHLDHGTAKERELYGELYESLWEFGQG